jgi:glycosyltransferase 2 family protein
VTGRRGMILRTLLGIAISVVAMALAVRAVDLPATAAVVRGAAPAWLATMVGFSILDVSLRGWRWQRLVVPVRRVPFTRMLGYGLIGYLANNVLPARLGELVRCHYLGEREGLSRTTALGTVVVERVIDTTAVVLIAAGAILLLSVRGVLVNAVLVGVAVAALLVLALGGLLVAHRLPGASRVATLADRWPQAGSLAIRLRDGLAVARHPRTLAEAIALTLAAWTMSVLAFAAAGQAIGVQLPIGQAALMSASVALATAIPSAPGYLGTFELAAVTVGQTFGLPPDRAFALALIVHAGILVVTTVGGAVAFLRMGWLGAHQDAALGGQPASSAPTGDAQRRRGIAER